MAGDAPVCAILGISFFTDFPFQLFPNLPQIILPLLPEPRNFSLQPELKAFRYCQCPSNFPSDGIGDVEAVSFITVSASTVSVAA